MASSSSAAPERSWTYHVFLSFRGQDTRKGFLDHLFASLERKGITAFRDDNVLQKGEVISDELLKAIEESMFAIVVLSPNYASSAWCLDELRKIVDCSRNLGLSVVPVFYGVDPSDVRYQKGSFGEALDKHGKRFGDNSDKVKGWRDALTQIASYSGWDSKDQHEARLVESIAQYILKKLIPKLPSCTENLIGIASRVEQVIRLMGKGLNDVRFVGIWGMGGIGKTTIARAVYEAIQEEFKVSCFLANVREVCETNGLVQIQKELAAHTNISMSTFNNVYDGARTIRNSLCNKKVLLVLDDVNEEDQLEILAGKKEWFGPGSRIIITTRDMHLLQTHEVHGIYEVEGLFQNEALHLFCLKAFKQDQPKKDYLDLSKEVVEYTNGLPLALKVLGSYLYGRALNVWHSAIKNIKSTLDNKILKTLEISYEGLGIEQRNAFLDIACFFRGMRKDDVSAILTNCDRNPEFAIDDLIKKSLVTLNKKGDTLDMHDLLQEMGKDIVKKESSNDPGKRSRLWSKEDIDLVLTKDKGTEAIQSIVLRSSYEARWSTEAFSKTSQLQFLSLYAMQFPLGIKYLPSSLKVLHWKLCPLKSLPLADQPYEFVEIKLWSSHIEHLWIGKKFLERLKYLDLSFSNGLKQIPDLSAVPKLEKLVLEFCSGLTELHLSLVYHKNLVILHLTGCQRLETLPGKLEMSSLKELILDDCKSFMRLPEFGECMKKLSRLSLKSTAIRKLPTSLGCLVGLEDLVLDNCKNLVCLPNTIHGLKFLRILSAGTCSKLCGFPPLLSRLPFLSSLNFSNCNLTNESFPLDFLHFPSLMDLTLSGNNFVTLPISIDGFPKLRYLRLNGCRNLTHFPELPSSIRELEACNCHSLNTHNIFYTLSRACSAFVSRNQNRGEVLQMVISGSEISSWFVHQQEGNCVSVPLSHNCPLNERLGIALCFLLQTSQSSSRAMPVDFTTTLDSIHFDCIDDILGGMPTDFNTLDDTNNFDLKALEYLSHLDSTSLEDLSDFDSDFDFAPLKDLSDFDFTPLEDTACIEMHSDEKVPFMVPFKLRLAIRNGDKIIIDGISPEISSQYHLYIVCFSNDYFSDEIHPDHGFELLNKDYPYNKFKTLSSVARWVSIKDIEDLNKGETKRPKRQKKLSVGFEQKH